MAHIGHPVLETAYGGQKHRSQESSSSPDRCCMPNPFSFTETGHAMTFISAACRHGRDHREAGSPEGSVIGQCVSPVELRMPAGCCWDQWSLRQEPEAPSNNATSRDCALAPAWLIRATRGAGMPSRGLPGKGATANLPHEIHVLRSSLSTVSAPLRDILRELPFPLVRNCSRAVWGHDRWPDEGTALASSSNSLEDERMPVLRHDRVISSSFIALLRCFEQHFSSL
jgi:hypothetical protein